MSNSLRAWFAESELFAYNVVRRDRWIAQQASRVKSGTRVLDVGAGSCPYRALFAHCDYRTQDLAPLRADQLRHGGYGAIDFVSDVTAIPVPDRSFGVVLCTEVLEHHPEPIRVVFELARILQSGGTLILTAPLGSGIHQEPYHYYGGYTPWWYERFLKAAGFEDITIEPNEGSFRFFGQESIRFLQTTSPWNETLPRRARFLWFPAWVALLPVLGLILPLLCKWLDKFDQDRRFTVGYHVTARRAPTPQ
ncbi:MAG: class I SAM-dependent methyltransferase [Nitrospira sp.]|nr:class I SAM-dependent methyltransferase [Nitrospira sp.]